MKVIAFAAAAMSAATCSAQAQAPAGAVVAPTETPVTIEYYYRLKWGSAGEFKKLYDRNHAPILREMQKEGRILRVDTEEPFTHLAGGVRWDLRVTITYRNADDALAGPGMMKGWEKAWGRLYKDWEAFSAEEAKRFSLVEDHWDVVVKPTS